MRMNIRGVLVVIGLALILTSFSTNGFAALYQVTHEVNLTDYWATPVFGQTGNTFLTTTFILDTGAAPVVFVPAGAPFSWDEGNWEHDLYGYDASAISNFSVTFGTKTWSNEDVQEIGGIAEGYPGNVSVWFDEALSDGGTPRTYMFLIDLDGDLNFGTVSGGDGTVSFTNESVVEDFSTGAMVWGYDTSVQLDAVPIPGAAWLLTSGLIGFIGFRRRFRKK